MNGDSPSIREGEGGTTGEDGGGERATSSSSSRRSTIDFMASGLELSAGVLETGGGIVDGLMGVSERRRGGWVEPLRMGDTLV